MYIAVGKVENNISVLDTADGVIESFEKDTLSGILSSGVTILGVTLDSLLVNSLAYVYIRYSIDGEDIDFDGYASFNANEVPDYYYQIVYLKDIKSEVDTKKKVNTLISHLRVLNKDSDKRYDISTASVTDTVVNYDGLGFDLASGEFEDIATILCDLYYNNCKYGGLDYIKGTGNYYIGVKFGSCVVKLDDFIFESWGYEDAYESTPYTDHISVISDITFAECDWLDIDKYFNGDKAQILSDCYYLPLYNIKRNVVETNTEFSTINDFTKRITGVDNVNVYTDDETMSLTEYYHYILAFPESPYSNEVEKNFKIYLAKLKLLKQTTKLNPYFNSYLTKNGTHITESSFGKTNKNYRSIIATPFGVIEIENNEYAKNYDTIFFTRLTHTGCTWLETGSNQVKFGAQKQLNDSYGDYDRFLCEKRLLQFFDDCCESEISYHDHKIIPLGVTSVYCEEGYIEIDVVCVVNYDGTNARKRGGSPDRSDYWWCSFGLSPVYMPLIFLGNKVEHSNGYYIFRLGLQNVYIPDSAINHLSGCFTNYNILGDFLQPARRKPDKKMYDNTLKLIEKEMKA